MEDNTYLKKHRTTENNPKVKDLFSTQLSFFSSCLMSNLTGLQCIVGAWTFIPYNLPCIYDRGCLRPSTLAHLALA